MFAVIKTGGKQYRVAAEDVITVARIEAEPGQAVTFDNVLMFSNESGTQLGAPALAGVSVAGEVVEQARGPKVIAFKKRRRQNSRRKRGHRQDLTVVRITGILSGDGAPSARLDAAEGPALDAAPAAEAPVPTEASAPASGEAAAEKKPRAARARTRKPEAGEPAPE
jgi:large subunit ribosomal protein L21